MEKLEKYDYSIEYHANVVRKTSKRENLHIIIRWYFPLKTFLVQRLTYHTAQKIIGQSTYFNSALPHFKKTKYNRILIAFSVTIFA